jgi:hypothetical protein
MIHDYQTIRRRVTRDSEKASLNNPVIKYPVLINYLTSKIMGNAVLMKCYLNNIFI